MKTAPKPLTVAGTVPLVPGMKNNAFGNVAPHRSEQPRRAEGPEDLAVGGITKEDSKPALEPTRWRSLRKAYSRCGELAAAGVQEHVERRYRSCRIQDVGIATVPVDLATTAVGAALGY